MSRFRDLFDPASPVILDAGWATELQKRGLAPGESPDAWNLARPDDVEAVARSFVEAGAQAILTNTFQGSPLALARVGLDGEARRINEEGARLSRRATGGANVRVLGSIGPTGRRRDLAAEAFTLQAEALAAGGVDALVLETFGDLAEAGTALVAARATGLPVVAAFYFDEASGEPRTADGSSPEAIAQAMAQAGADAVGANCGAGIAGFAEVCRRLASACDLPIWIKPNAGLPTIVDGKAVYETTADAFAAALPELVAAGAAFVGGCCGTSPEFIRALRIAARGRGPAR